MTFTLGSTGAGYWFESVSLHVRDPMVRCNWDLGVWQLVHCGLHELLMNAEAAPISRL